MEIPLSNVDPFVAAEEPETDYRTSSNRAANGSKGEGTAGTPRFLFNSTTNSLEQIQGSEGYPDGSYGRGAPGNAGGGGYGRHIPLCLRLTPQQRNEISFNGENTGGGGGGNGGAGGLGGRSFRSQVYIQVVSLVQVFPSTSNRLALGGGGGAGTTNDDR